MGNYKKLNNQPLTFVLAEFRFSPVMQIADYIPRIQEALRKRYPMPGKRSEQTVQVQPGGIAVSNIDGWVFASANRRSAIEINPERLVYITAEYPRFGGFSDSCRLAIETLERIVEPTLILRTGLRYSDRVLVDDNEKITDLVIEHFGLPSCIDSLGKFSQYSTNTSFQTGMGSLVIRTLYGKHNLPCFPDVQSLPIQIDMDDTPSERIILDFDHFWEAKDKPVNFETNAVLDILTKLHDTSREAFWKVTTDYAKDEKWA